MSTTFWSPANRLGLTTFARHSGLFKCKDLGLCRYFLGLEVNQAGDNIEVSQKGYAERVLKRFDMENCNDRQTPMDPNSFPTCEEPDDIRTDPTSYQSLTGSVNFLVTGTRPDLAFPCGVVSMFNAKPAIQHLNVAKGTLRYI